MFNSENLAVDIGSSYIKILIGDKRKVKSCGLIKTPEKSVADDNILNAEAICNSIKGFLNSNNVKPNKVSFAIHGHDIIIRHIEIPIMDDKDLRKSVEWEISQYLPENGTNYFIDYEVVSKTNTQNRKTQHILVVAAPKSKINKYVELSTKLDMKINAIDVASNCLGRVFKLVTKEAHGGASTGILDIGYRNSNTVILDDGKLFIEREVPFGIKNAVMEVSRFMSIDEDEAYMYLFNKFSFDNIKPDDEVHNRIQSLFERAMTTFDKVIQFYTSGKSQKSLDKIYIMGGGATIPGVASYLEEYFGCPVCMVDSSTKSKMKIKFPRSFDLKVYANALGLLLRKE